MKKTFNLDDELCEALEAWRQRDEQTSGYQLSLNNLVSRLLRKCVVEEQQSKERSEEK